MEKSSTTKRRRLISDICQDLRSISGSSGLGTELFEAISSLTPIISVELIIKRADEKQTLLTWRDDKLYGPGWHVPGGVVRFKESLRSRVEKVLEQEVGVGATDIIGPVASHEIFNKERDIRGHFVSFVFKVILASDPPDQDQARGNRFLPGQWRWFLECPNNLIKNQNSLKVYINDEQ